MAMQRSNKQPTRDEWLAGVYMMGANEQLAQMVQTELQRSQKLPPGEPQREHAGEPEQQPRVPRGRSPASAVDSAPGWTGRPPDPVETHLSRLGKR